MKIAVQSGGPEELYGVDGAYRLIKEAGFDAVDANLDHLLSGHQIQTREKPEVFTTDDEELFYSYFQPWKDAAEKYGLDNYQAHAPFPSLLNNGEAPDDPYNDFLIEMLKRVIKGCAYIGCHRLVIHPFFQRYDSQMDPQTEWDVNIRSYSRLIETAKKYGVMILLENMFTRHKGKIMAAICNDMEMASCYVDKLNEIAGEKVFGFCMDIGHLHLVSLDVKNALIRMGDRIEAFHVHDNDGVDDQHLAPYMGKVDWNRFVEGLAAIGYDKTMSFETYNIFNVIDPELCPDMMKMIAHAGRMFAERAHKN